MNFNAYSDFETFLEAQQHKGYRMCQTRGTYYVHGGTVAVRNYVCVVEGKTRARSSKKCHISKLGTGSCNASFQARYSVDAEKKPRGSVALDKVNLIHEHEPVLRGQAVPRGTRRYIEEQLARGVGPERVASDLQAEALKPENRETLRPNRVLYLKKSYFRAKHRLLNAKEIELDKDEHRSVVLGVAERWSNCTLYHHPLGTEGELAATTFCLILSSGFQRHLLSRYGGPSRIVFFDAPHDTVKYRDFCLFTLLVIDEAGRGYPAAWMISNAKTAAIQTHFLRVAHNAVPEFGPGAVMIDEAPAARSAVRCVFPNSRLYYWDFYLWRSWQRKLASCKIPLTPKVARHLAILRRSPHEGEFDTSCAQLVRHFKQTSSGTRFWEYLLHNYLYSKRLLWAGCYRRSSHATNNHIESWHNRLKSHYLKRKSKVRLDQYASPRSPPCISLLTVFSLVHCLLVVVETDIYHKYLLNNGFQAPRPSPVAGAGTVPDQPAPRRKSSSLPLEERRALMENSTMVDHLDGYESVYDIAIQARSRVPRAEGAATKLSKQ